MPPVQYVFFAERAKPASMRRALAQRLSVSHSVVVVTEAVSVVRDPLAFVRAGRLEGRPIPGQRCELRPVYLPARLPLVGRLLDKVNHSLLTRELAALADPWRDGDRVVFFDSPSQFSLVGGLGESRSVYLCIDDRTVTVTGEDIAGEKIAERRLLRSVDQVICVSQPLADVLRSRVPERPDLRIDVVSNGYNEHLFRSDAILPEPVELASIPRPRVLVVGHVSDRIDWKGIEAFARRRPKVAWIFLGPADAGMAERIAAIGAATGTTLRLQAPVPLAAVPAWLMHADVCAAPYSLNSFTRTSSPLKVIEYLGAGAPVVTTRVGALAPFSEAVQWLDEGDGASYEEAIDAALSEARSPAALTRRAAAVASHTWSHKAHEVTKLLSDING